MLQTLKQTAQDPSKVLAFNYASEALNNSFFLSTLVCPSPLLLPSCVDQTDPPVLQQSPTPSAPTPSSSFSQQLLATPSLGSFPALISHFSAHVSGLHPSSAAYVWLVTDPNGNLGVVGTYAGGTVLVKERRQMGFGSYAGQDLRVLGEEVEAAAGEASEASSSTPSSSSTPAAPAWKSVTSPSSRRQQPGAATANLLSEGSLSPSSVLNSALASHHGAAAIGKQLHPLVCLSTHPHCYLEDYGLWGRDEYVKKWWGAVDWKKVEEAYEGFVRKARV